MIPLNCKKQFEGGEVYVGLHFKSIKKVVLIIQGMLEHAFPFFH